MVLVGSAASKMRTLRGDRTQREVAESVGISANTYCSYEAGARVPRDEIKSRIADYYGVQVQDIFF